jgi:hypothetical protein
LTRIAGPALLAARRAGVRPRAAAGLARIAGAALLAGAAAAGVAGCGGSLPRPAALRLERADVVLLAHALQHFEGPAREEVAAARAVWPALVGGLPARVTPALQRGITASANRAGALALPQFVADEGALTGPAAKVGGMLKGYIILSQRGWQHLAAAAPAAAATAGGTFLRANAGLYIYSVYDGHYDLSLIGKALQGAYHALGGAPAFGTALTQGQVEALARAYSIPATRLAPHPPPGVTV